MFMIRLSDGKTAFRLDADESEGESIDDAAPVTRPPGAYEVFDWDAQDFVPASIAVVEADLLAKVDEARDRLAAAELNRNVARANEYTIKLIEALSDSGPWPWLQDLATRKGTDVETERLAVLVARDADDAKVRAIAGVAVAAKAAIRAAATTEGKLAAFDAIVWPTDET